MASKGEQLQRDHGLNLVHLLGFNHLKSPDILQPIHVPSQTVRPLSCNKTVRQTAKKLRKKVRKINNSPIEVVAVPEGDSLFMSFKLSKAKQNQSLHSMIVVAAMPV